MPDRMHEHGLERVDRVAYLIHRRGLAVLARRRLPERDDVRAPPQALGPCEVIDSTILEESLDVKRLWWELHPDGEYGRPDG
jgi:hypothetical protein